MKTVKFLIVTAILSTSFYACKKEEMNIKSSEVSLLSDNQNSSSLEESGDLTDGMIRIVFSNVGAMVIEGNPNLEKLISMYNASETAINSAKEVFELTNDDKLSIVFDRDGYAVASDIPKVLIGSSIDAFIFDFCKVKPMKAMTLEISKDNLTRNYEEFWNALPEGVNESFLSQIKELQAELPMNYSLKVSFEQNQAPSVIYLDENGDPQPIQNSQAHCVTIGSGYVISVSCFFKNFIGWI